MRAAVALRPESAHSVMNLGNGYEHLGQHDQAIACYRKAIELQPNYSAMPIPISASRSVEKGLYEEAIAAFEQAIKLTPQDASIERMQQLGDDSQQLSGRAAFAILPGGRSWPRKRSSSNRKRSNHWTALGIARYRQSQWQEARTAFDKSLQLGTEVRGVTARSVHDAIDWFFLAMSHWQLGEQDEARQCYDRAVEWMEKGRLAD